MGVLIMVSMTGKNPAKNPELVHQMIAVVENSTSQKQLGSSLAPVLDSDAGEVSHNLLLCSS
jgi:hypothetical protein